jgi:hypothetical protein
LRTPKALGSWLQSGMSASTAAKFSGFFEADDYPLRKSE